jgi:hypothetical protein
MTNMLTNNKIISLIRNVAKYGALEKLVAVQYFLNSQRTKEQEAKWLGHQTFKEWTGSGVYGKKGVNVGQLILKVAEDINNISETFRFANLNLLEQQLSFASDEFRHCKDLASAYYYVDPESDLTISELGSIIEGEKLSEMRYEFRTTPLGCMAVDLSEGGCLGLYFGICAVFNEQNTESELDRMILRVGKNTLADEMSHMSRRYLDAYNAGYSEAEWIQLDSMLQQICWQKLLERNEQFSKPFSEYELKEKTNSFEAADEFIDKHLLFLFKKIGLKPAWQEKSDSLLQFKDI